MVKYRIILTGMLAVCLSVGLAAAKSIFLPDYTPEYSSRTPSRSSNKPVEKYNCARYGYESATKKGYDCKPHHIGNLLCYTCTKCGSQFKYETCSSPATLGGSTCGGYHDKCVCPSSYQTSSSSCGTGMKLGSRTCTGSDGVTKTECIEDQCYKLTTPAECKKNNKYCTPSSDPECSGKCMYEDCDIDACTYHQNAGECLTCTDGAICSAHHSECSSCCTQCTQPAPQCSYPNVDPDEYWCTTPNQNCATLGYNQTSSSCSNGQSPLKCPFGSAYKCVGDKTS